MKYTIAFALALCFGACTNKRVEEKVVAAYPDGKPKTVNYFNPETQEKVMEREFYDNEKTYLEWNFSDGKKNGESSSFRKDGKPWSTHTYLNDTLHGPYKTWHENGQLYMNGQFNQGKKSGMWFFYDNTGKEIKKIDFDSVVPDSTQVVSR
jgi:antitoxin component YwqK of YwqJK toxin-antitoxin module